MSKVVLTLNEKPIETGYTPGSIEDTLMKETSIDRRFLDLPHRMFKMKIEGEDLVFELQSELQRMVYNDALVEGYQKTVTCTQLIFSEQNDESFDIIAMNAGNANLSRYRESIDAEEYRLMCHICYQYYMAKFDKIKSLDDITKPVPTPLFFRVLNKIASKYDFVFVDKEDDIEYAGRLRTVQINRSFFSSSIGIHMAIVSRGKDGYVQGPVAFKIPLIHSMQKVEDIGLRIMTDEDRARFNERGQKYVKYTQKPTYCYYKGFARRPGGWMGDPRVNVDGRIMIDICGMRALNANIEDNWFTGNPFEGTGTPIIDEDKLWMTSPVVFGFSLATKEWIKMDLEGVSDIQFSENAFDELIIPEEHKDIFVACLTNDMPSLDSIEGKGSGKIFLLYGPPGVGKTLTAESVAEYLRKPLYYVSVGELGISPNTMEESLAEIMEVATTWDAIVLLDEVDIFAMKRTGTDIERNAMVGILLRLLERYSGVMFMTTNLKDNLDEAFISRATASIEYKALDASTRVTIWKGLLKKVSKLGVIIDEEIHSSMDELSRHELNGRAIKNKVRLAYSVASSKKDKKLTYKTLTSVINM